MGTLAPLHLYWNSVRQDNLTTATKAGWESAIAAGYQYIRTEGWIDTGRPWEELPSTFLRGPSNSDENEAVNQAVAFRNLDLYWSDDRSDNFSTATDQGRRDAQAAGYRLIRTEGRLYDQPYVGYGAVPIDTYWSPERNDNILTATDEGRQSALQAGYRQIRTEGYCRPPVMNGCGVFWHPGRRDYFTASAPESQLAAAVAGYLMVSGVPVWDRQVLNMVSFDSYWNDQRQDNLTTANAAAKTEAEAAGYRKLRSEGWLFPNEASIPTDWNIRSRIDTYWNYERQDHLTANDATARIVGNAHGYVFLRTEGYFAARIE